MVSKFTRSVGEGVWEGPVPDFKTRSGPTWTLEDPDKRRGWPFRSWLGPRDDEIREYVECPMGFEEQGWIKLAWRRNFPDLYAWFNDDTENRPYRWRWIVFVKSDWSKSSGE